MLKRKLDEVDIITATDTPEKRRRTEISFEDLPNEIIHAILIFIAFNNSAHIVCHKWTKELNKIVDSQPYFQRACTAYWGTCIVSVYDCSDEEEKKKMLKGYLIPVINDVVDRRRYHSMRLNFASAMKLFLPSQLPSELKRSHIKYLITVIKNTGDLCYEKRLAATRLIYDVARISLEQGDEAHTQLDSLMTSVLDAWSNDSSVTDGDFEYNVKICKVLLKFYKFVNSNQNNWNVTYKAVIEQIATQFVFFTFVKGISETSTYLEWYVRADIESKEREFISWFEHNVLERHSSSSRDLVYAYLLDLVWFQSENYATGTVHVDMITLLTAERAQLFSESHLEYLANEILHIDLQQKSYYISRRFFKNLLYFGNRLELFLPKLTTEFCKDSRVMCQYLYYTLRAYPAEAQRAVIDLFENQKDTLLSILAEDAYWSVEPIHVIENSFGVKWAQYGPSVVELMLSQFPEELTSLPNFTFGNLDHIPGFKASQTQRYLLQGLLLVPATEDFKKYQHRILYLALIQLNADLMSKAFRQRILGMPIMKVLCAETLPYFTAIASLSDTIIGPVSAQGLILDIDSIEDIEAWRSTVVKLESVALLDIATGVAKMVIEHPSRAWKILAPLVLQDNVVASAHLAVCYNGVSSFKKYFGLHVKNSEGIVSMEDQEALNRFQGLMAHTRAFLETMTDSKHYNIIKLFFIFAVCSSVEPSIGEYTVHNHDWNVVRAAMRHQSVQARFGSVLLPQLLLLLDAEDPTCFNNMIPKYIKHI